MKLKDRWLADASNRQELEKILQNPILLFAFEVLRERELSPISGPGNVDLVQYFAIMGAKKEGYVEYPKSLFELSEVIQPIRKDPPPWSEPAKK